MSPVETPSGNELRLSKKRELSADVRDASVACPKHDRFG